MKKILDLTKVLVETKADFEQRGAGGTYTAMANSLALIDPESKTYLLESDSSEPVIRSENKTVFVDLSGDGSVELGCDTCGGNSANILSSSSKSVNIPTVEPITVSSKTVEVPVEENLSGSGDSGGLVDDFDGDKLNALGDSEPESKSVVEPIPSVDVTGVTDTKTMTTDVLVSEGIKTAERVAYSNHTKKEVDTPAKLLARFGGNYDLLKSWAIGQKMQVKFLKGDAMVKKVYELLPE